jgi:hypothetical protein
MDYFNNEKDNIISIVQSLRPIKKIYSKQNRDYDKYFHGSNLKDLIKRLETQRKFNEFLKNGENIDELNGNKSIMEINFKNTINYIKELSNLKNIHILNSNKSFEHNKTIKKENKNNKKRLFLIKKVEMERDRLLKKKDWDKNHTLDPGRYNPKYDYIRKKIPCTFFGSPKIKDDSSIQNEGNKIIENNEKKYNDDKKVLKVKSHEKFNSMNSIIENKIENPKNKKLLETMPHRILSDKNYNPLESETKPNFNRSNYLSSYKNNSNKKELSQYKIENVSSIIFRNQNTAPSWNNTADFDHSRKASKLNKSKYKNSFLYYKSKFRFYNTKRKIYVNGRNKKESLKNSSVENLRCPILFNKMMGRESHMNFVKIDEECYKTIYHPEYNIVRPHIPTIKFNSERQNPEFKKYMIGKIIRSYSCNPKEYFIFEFNENKVKKLI